MLGAFNFQNLVGIQTETERYVLNLCKQKPLEKVQNPSTSRADSLLALTIQISIFLNHFNEF
jgi:hypothetical protein